MKHTIYTILLPTALKSSERKPRALLSIIVVFLFMFLFSMNTYGQCIKDNDINLKRPICDNSKALLEGSRPSGGNGSFTYIWEINKTGNCGENKFDVIPGATGEDYSVPLRDPDNVCYRRVAISGNCRVESNKINMNRRFDGIALPDVNITQPTCAVPTGSFKIIEPETAESFNVNGVNYPSTTDTYSNLSPGTYNVTVKYAGGCTSPVVNVVINQPPSLPTGSITPASAAICQGGGQALTASGGTSYQWQLNGNMIIGATSATYTAKIPGDYSVIILKDGCSAPASNIATITIAPSPELKVTNPAPSCTTVDITGSAITAGSSPGLAYSYWTDQNATSPVANPKAVGGGTYYIKATNSNGCTSIAPLTVTVKPSPTGSIAPASPSFCTGSSVTLNGPSNFASYQWYRNGSLIASATSVTYLVSQSGTYAVDFTTADGCKGTASTTVTATDLPSAPITPTTAAICPAGSVVLSTSGGTSYQWYKDGVAIVGATQNTYTVTALGMYTADIISGDCKVKTSNGVTVTEVAAPTGTITSSTTSLCPGASAILTATGGTTYQWYKDGIQIANAVSSVYTATQAGRYTADILNGSCIGKATNEIVIVAGALPTGNITPATLTFCEGQSATLTVSGGTTYQWYRNGIAINGATTATLSIKEAGNYTADIINANGCIGKANNTSTVTLNPIPTGSISPEKLTICRGGSGLLTASGGTSYQWYKDGAVITGATNATYTVDDPGGYSVDIINGACIGKASNTVTVTVGADLSGTITPANAQLCEGGSILLTATGGSSFQWYKDGVAINGATGNTYTATEIGTYTANVFSGTCRGRVLNEAVITKGNAPAGIIAPAVANLCNGGSAVLSVSGGTSYQWYRDGIAIPNAIATNYTATLPGIYTVDIVSGGCKGKATNNVTVSQITPPSGAISPATGSICTGETVVLRATGGKTYQWYRNGGLISGAVGATYTVTEIGVYRADIFSDEGCIGKSTNEANITSKSAPTGTLTPAIVSLCSGVNAIGTATGGSSYQWYKDGAIIPSATQNTYTITSAGVYSADIINGGCKGKASNEIVATLTMAPSGNITPAATTICAGGTAILTATGGVTYQWYKDGSAINGATGATLSVIEAGSYTTDIISAGGCKGKATNESKVDLKATPTGTISPATLTLCNGGSSELTATGGTSYQWYKDGVEIPGARSNIYTATQAGTYAVDIFNEGCKGKASNSAVVNIGASLNGTIQPTSAILCNNGSVVLTATGGSTYQWYKNGQLINGAVSSTYTATTTGTYSVELISGNCKGRASNEVVIAAGSVPSGIISPSAAALCANGSVLLTVSGGTTYQWYKDGVAISGAISTTYNATAIGIYTADIINGDCKGKSINSAVVATAAGPVGTISPANISLCTGGTASLTATGGTAYQWYRNGSKINSATQATLTVNEAGTYTADIINGSCTSKATNEAVVTIGASPTGTITPASGTICTGGSLPLTATGGATYQWYKDGIAINGATSNTYTATTTGTYTVDLINGNCKGKASNEVIVTAGAAPIGSISPATASLCTNGSIELTASGGDSYQWYKDGAAIDGAKSAIYIVSAPGVYSVVIMKGSCSGPATNTVNITTSSTINFNSTVTTPSCAVTTGTITFTNVAGGSGNTYTYSIDNAVSFRSGNTFGELQPGTYQLVVKDASGCRSAAQSVTIKQAESTLSATANTTDAACGRADGVVTITSTGGIPDYLYSLDKGNFQVGNVFSNIAIGKHDVVVKDKAGCTVTVTFEIKASGQTPNLVINNPTAICPGSTTNLKDAAVTTGSDAGLTFTYWTNTIATTAVADPEKVSVGTYYIKATTSAGCFAIKPVVVSQTAVTPGTITPATPAVTCSGTAVTLTASSGSSYQWYKDDVLIPGATEASYKATDDGRYSVVISNGTCAVKASNTVVVRYQSCIPASETKVFVPTAFTPNKNGANDLLQPYFLNVQQLVQFKVYNRWGQLVYQTNVIGEGWDGKIRGLPQPSETYSWILECIDFTGKTIKQSGRSLLIR